MHWKKITIWGANNMGAVFFFFLFFFDFFASRAQEKTKKNYCYLAKKCPAVAPDVGTKCPGKKKTKTKWNNKLKRKWKTKKKQFKKIAKRKRKNWKKIHTQAPKNTNFSFVHPHTRLARRPGGARECLRCDGGHKKRNKWFSSKKSLSGSCSDKHPEKKTKKKRTRNLKKW